MVESVGFDGLIVEPRAVTGLPFVATDHAEFSRAATCHVIAAFFKFDHGGAVEASLPAFLLGDFDEFLGLFVFRAVSTGVPFAVADAANLGMTSFALPVLAAAVCINIFWFDPLAASA